jgi:hypothetical protein
MNSLNFYTRQKEPWSDTEINQIKDEYEIYEFTISQIADIHRRTPGSISYKLKNLKLINHNMLARGYDEYKNSNLYKEIVKNGKIEDAEKKQKKLEKIKAKNEIKSEIKSLTEIKNIENILLQNEISEIKKNITDLKCSVSELTEMIKATYEFEEIEVNDNPKSENIVNKNDNNTDSIYQNIINEYTNKENELAAKIKYYNEHKEQLIRIKLLEAEFTNLQNDINSISSKKIMEIEKKKREDEYFKIISENCKDAFQMYLLNLRNNIRNPQNIQINTLCRKYYINYTFNKINDNSYKVSSKIPNYGFDSAVYVNNIDGIYDIENGFKSY